MTWLYKAIATLHLLYGSLFLQAQDAVSQRNYQKLEKIMKTTREDEVRNSKTKTWEENMGQNHITVSEENRQRLRKLLKGVPEFPTNLFEEAGKLTADTKQFDEKYNQIEREREVWKENLERCFGKFTRILKKEDAERKGTPFIIPRDVYFYHEKKAVRALDFNPQKTQPWEYASTGTDRVVAVHKLELTAEDIVEKKLLTSSLYVAGEKGIRFLKYSSDGKWFYTGDDDSHVIRWVPVIEAVKPTLYPNTLRTKEPKDRKLTALCIDKQEHFYYGYYTSNAWRDSIYASKESSSENPQQALFAGASEGKEENPLYKMCLSEDESVLATASSQYMYFYNVPPDTNLLKKAPLRHEAGADVQGVNGMVALPDGLFAYSLSKENSVFWCDSSTLKASKIPNPIGVITSLVYDSTRSLLIGGELQSAGQAGGNMIVWDMEDREHIKYALIKGVGTLERAGHNSTIWSLAISPDKRWLLSGGDKGEICLWDMNEIEAYVGAKQQHKTPTPPKPKAPKKKLT